MKIIRNVILLLVVMTLLSGCFSVSTAIKLNKNGSGTLEEKFLMKPMNMFGKAQTNAEQMYDEEQLRADAYKYGEGVKFKSGEAVIGESSTPVAASFS